MTTFSIIQKSQLEGAKRLDAEYFQPEYLELENKITGVKFSTIKDLSEKVFSGPFGSTLKSESYQDSGIPFIRIGDIADIFINKDNLVYISEEEHRRIYSTHLNIGDIVLSKIATVGRLSVIDNKLGEINISENNIGIRLQNLDENIRAYVLFFLLSKFGQLQILRRVSGNIQLKLNVSDIESIALPITKDSQNKIFADYYSQVMKKRRMAIDFYQQAENLLLEELGLKDFNTDQKLFSIVNLSDVQSANRIDAEYFQEKYNKLINKLKNPVPLNKISKRIKEIIKIDRNKNYKYIEISDVNVGSGEINYNNISAKDLPANAKIKINGGEMILSKVRPTRGAIAIIPDDWKNDFVASGAFSIFKILSPMREYLQVVLRSIVGKLQIERPTTGTTYPTVTDEDVENILIPILSKETQQKIAELVQKAHISRKKAKELLEEAKRKVEEIIEK